MTESNEEKLLLARCSQGDRDSFAILYTRYLTPLCRYLYLFTRSKEESEEIVQDVFVRIWKEKANLATVQSFQPYLFKAAKNRLLDQLRRKESEMKIIDSIRPLTEESREYSDSELIYTQYHQIAENAKDRLSQKRKQIFEMSFEEDLSLDEIALRLAISKSVVKKQLYAATDFIREYLRKHAEITTELVIFLSICCPSI